MKKKTDLKVLLVAQEIQLAKLLAGNDKNARDKALVNLRKWMSGTSTSKQMAEEDFQRIWKGLFYSMWMSDKPLIQEECSENIASLIHFPQFQTALLFFKAGLTTIANEWQGIDQHRLDKFLMLVRRLLRQMLIVLRQKGYTKHNIENFNDVIYGTLLEPTTVPLGLFMHFTEIFMEELAKTSDGRIPKDQIVEIVEPFIKKLASSSEARYYAHISKYIFTYLIKQTDLGIEYQVKYDVWRKLGFPGSINSIQKIKKSEESDDSEVENEENFIPKTKHFDPRAGRVDVDLPQIKFNAKAMANALLRHKSDKNSNKKTRQILQNLADKFMKLSKGIYPFGITKLRLDPKNEDTIDVRKAAKKLIKFEQNLLKKDRKRKFKKTKNTKNDKDSGEEENVEPAVKKRKVIATKSGMKKKSMDNKKTCIVQNKDKLNTKLKNANKINADNIEHVFERNSGVWVVYNTSKEVEDHKKPNQSGSSLPIASKDIESIPKSDNLVPNKQNKKKIIKPIRVLENILIAPAFANVNGSRRKQSELFPKCNWEESDGVDLIRHSPRKQQRVTYCTSSSNQIQKNSRVILGKKIKKVKINTKLNSSQEFHEHHQQILSSPAIPYDANKKPSKPLLKTPTKTTPINPFYKLRFSS